MVVVEMVVAGGRMGSNRQATYISGSSQRGIRTRRTSSSERAWSGDLDVERKVVSPSIVC